NYPPYLRYISPTLQLKSLTLTNERLRSPAAPSLDLLGTAELTSSCYHVNGWNNITEIQFKLSDASSTIFLAKYVAAENKVYVEDPDPPGTFLPGITPGSGPPIETANVILDVPHMTIFHPGGASAVLEVKWPLSFKPPTFLKDYVQSINIGYTLPPAAS